MALTLIALISAFGCGKVKTQDDKVLKIESSGPANTNDTLMSIATLLDLYGHPELGQGGKQKAFSADEIKNILQAFKGKIESMLNTKDIPIDEIIDTAVKFFPSFASGVTPEDVLKGIKNNLPLVTWFESRTDLTKDELFDKITSQFKNASPAARDGIFKTLLRFDDTNLTGNNDTLLNAKELAFPIILMSAISKMSIPTEDIFSKMQGIPIEKLTKRQIQSKLEQQIYGRYLVNSYKNLPEEDIKLELMQLSLKFYQATLAANSLGIQGELYPKVIRMALKSIAGIEELTVSNNLIQLYDSSVLAGDENGFLNTIELFNLATDVELAHQMHEKNPYSLYENPEVISSLVSAFQVTAKSVFGSSPNGKPSKIWDDLENFDDEDRGGNGDGKIADTELAVAIASVRLIDLIYEIYDVNTDGIITRDEAIPLFKKVLDSGTSTSNNKCLISGFFADIRFNSMLGKPGVYLKMGMTCAFSFLTKNKLAPVEFYTRLVNTLPYILDNIKKSKRAK